MGTKLGNELHFLNEKCKEKSKALELLERAKEIEKNLNLRPFRVNRNTIILISKEKYESIKIDKAYENL